MGVSAKHTLYDYQGHGGYWESWEYFVMFPELLVFSGPVKCLLTAALCAVFFEYVTCRCPVSSGMGYNTSHTACAMMMPAEDDRND